MLSNVARKVETAGGKILKISMMKGRKKLIPYFKNLCLFFHEIRQNAEQLNDFDIWKKVLMIIFRQTPKLIDSS